jgi:hypothetical protein
MRRALLATVAALGILTLVAGTAPQLIAALTRLATQR